MNMASLPGLGGVYSKSSLGLSFPTSQLELDSPTCRCLSWGCASFLSRTLLRYQVIGLILQHHGGESWEGSGRLGSNEALVTPAASCPWLFSCCPARLRSHCPTPTPSSSKLLIPDSCDGCGQRWGGGRRESVSPACCWSGHPHHLTVWGQERHLPFNSPRMVNSWNGPPLSLSPEAMTVLFSSQEGLSSDRGGPGT